jgi:hypothetical protein
MSFCTSEILNLAGTIHENINSPTSISVGYLSGVLTSSGMIGELNNRLTTDYWISGGSCIAGGFGAAESAILALMVETNYYRRQALCTLQGGGAGGVTVIREGDTTLQRTSPTEIAKGYQDLRRQSEHDLSVMVANWKLGHSMSVQVCAAPMASYPTP